MPNFDILTHKKSPKFIKFILLSLISIGTTTSKAELHTLQEEKTTTLEQVTVTSSSREESRKLETLDKPYTSSYISSDQIQTFRGTSPSDFIKGIAGMESGDARNSGALDINIRGMQGQGRVPIIVDGTLQSNTVYRGYNGAGDRSYLDPDLISHVKVGKGPLLNARSGIGGIVEIQTLMPEDILLPDQKFGVMLRGLLQSNNHSIRAGQENTVRKNQRPHKKSSGDNWNPQAHSESVAFAGKLENGLDFVLAFSNRELGNYYSGSKGYRREAKKPHRAIFKAKEEVFNTSNHTKSMLLKSIYHISSEQQIEASFRKQWQTFGEIMPSQIYRNTTGFVGQWRTGHIDLAASSIKYTFSPSDNPFIQFSSTAWLTNLKNSTRNADPFAAPVPQGQVMENAYASDDTALYKMRSTRKGIDLSNTADLGKLPLLGSSKLNVAFSYMNERERPGHGVTFTEEDYQFNRVMRHGTRDEWNSIISLNFSPLEWAEFELGGHYQRYKTKDKNHLAHNIPGAWMSNLNIVDANSAEIYPEDLIKFSPIDKHKYYEQGINAEQLMQLTLPNKTDFLEEGMNTSISTPYYFDKLKQTNPDGYQALTQYAQNNGQSLNHFEIVASDPGSMQETYRYDKRMKRKGHSFSPTYVARFHLNDNVDLFLRQAQTTRQPSLFETTMGFGAVGLRKLRPERSFNTEIGLNGFFGNLFKESDQLNFKFSYFHTKTKDYISRRNIHKGEPEYNRTRRPYFMFYNLDKTVFAGFDAQLDYYHPSFFVNIAANYLTTHKICSQDEAKFWGTPEISKAPNLGLGKCNSVGFPAGYINAMVPPRSSGTLILGKYFFNKKLSIGTRTRYIGQPPGSGTREKVAKPGHFVYQGTDWSSYVIHDIFAEYAFNKQSKIKFNIDNITNRYYYDALSLSLMPAPGRTARMSLEYKF